MKRQLSIFIILTILAGTAMAQTAGTEQEKYADLISRTEQLPAYEALYHMLAYQRFHPENAPIYYRMGEVVYSLLPSKDPLHDYAERAELLYKGKLFYGNCLHFLDGRVPKGEPFASVQPAGKRLEYEDLERYLRAHLDTIQRWRMETDTLRNRFYRMVARYEAGRQLFMQFVEKYPSEKLAHLCLTDDDRNTLNRLNSLAAMFEQDKQLFLDALTTSPIAHYKPQFRSIPVQTYRLDGLTSSDFLANDIPLWDYGTWTTSFLQTQRDTYQALVRDLLLEHNTIEHAAERFRQKQPINYEPDGRIAYRLERYDYDSPIASLIRMEQAQVATLIQAQDTINIDEQMPDDQLATRISDLLEAQRRYTEAAAQLQTMKARINEATPRKYASFMKDAHYPTIQALVSSAEDKLAYMQQITAQIESQLQAYAEQYQKQYDKLNFTAVTQ